jgi:putative membrane protein
MTPDTLDDDRLGMPTALPRQAPPPVQPPPAFDPEPSIRPGETDLGRPEQRPAGVSPLSDTDRERLRAAEEAQALRDLSEAEELTASDPAVGWFGWFAHPLAAAFLLGAAGALGLFVYSQSLQVLANLAAQPPVVQWLGYIGLVVCGGAVLFAAGRFVLVYVRLRRNRQLRLAGLEELHQRTRLRWLAHAKAAEARTKLEQYLRDFPLDTPKQVKKLAALGVGPDRVAALEQVRSDLLDPARFSGTAEWFERFRTGFQIVLDQAAEERIGYWARRSGVATALAPNGLVDSAAMLYFGFALLTDLCEVYHLRTGKTGTAVLLGRVFFNSYLSGQISEWEKLTEQQLNGLLTSAGHVAPVAAVLGGLSPVIAPLASVLSKAGAKGTSGLLNGLLIARLGRYACRLLRPVG